MAEELGQKFTAAGLHYKEVCFALMSSECGYVMLLHRSKSKGKMNVNTSFFFFFPQMIDLLFLEEWQCLDTIRRKYALNFI